MAQIFGLVKTPDVVALPPDLTADEAMHRLRALAEEVETIYYSYVTDPTTDRLLGVLSLHRLVLGDQMPIRELMVTEPIQVRADASQVDAARLLDQYHLLAIPVVDGENRLVGMVTADDAAEVLLEEAGEDIERLRRLATGSTSLTYAPLLATYFRKRVLWLLLLFVAEACTGSVLRLFEDTLSRSPSPSSSRF